MLRMEGILEVKGKVGIGAGSRIDVGKNATLSFIGNVANSAGVTIVCGDRITIGNNTVISWDTLIIDTDFHYVMDLETGKTKPMHRPISIGENTWLCAGSKILKGSVLPDGCILSAGSVLNKRFDECNCLLVGNPCDITRRGVTRSDKELN